MVDKKSFASIYAQRSPDAYFSALSALKYRSYDFAWEWAQRASLGMGESHWRGKTVVDVGCSYGINGLSLKCGLPFSTASTIAEVCGDYVNLFAALSEKRRSIRIVGVDTAVSATEFALDAGLIDDAITTDVNTENLSEADRGVLGGGVDLLLASGVFSYVGAEGFERLLNAIDPNSGFEFVGWPLFGDDLSALVKVCRDQGLTSFRHTEALLPQRLYASDEERDSYRQRALERGLDFDNTLADRFLCATQFVASKG